MVNCDTKPRAVSLIVSLFLTDRYRSSYNASGIAMASEDSAIGSSSNGGLEEAQSAKAEQMNAHPNMHFDTQAGKWMFEDAETGQEYEWNTTANAWLPVMDEEMLEAQQKAYSVQGVDETVCNFCNSHPVTLEGQRSLTIIGRHQRLDCLLETARRKGKRTVQMA